MAVTAFQDYPLADRDREWDGAAAEKRVRRWAGAEDEPNEKYRDAHVWYDSASKDNFTGYKLLIADVIGENIMAVPRGVMAAGQIMQGARGVDAPAAAGFGADAEAGGGGLVGVDGRLGGLVRRASDAELLLVPQVDAGLVADLYRGGQVAEHLVPGLDDRVLGGPGQVRAVVVGEVVVEDARLRRLAGDHVPHRLVQAPRDQVPAGQVQRG